MTSSDRVLVGAIASAHGIKGQVKIKFFSENADALLKRNDFSDASGSRSFKLKKHGITNGLVIASIDGLSDRNSAELLKGTQLFAPLPKSQNKANQWSYGELTGLEARLENGQAYGKIIGVYNFGAGDVIELELADGKNEMLPFTHEFVGTVNMEQGYVVIVPPEYLTAEEPS